MRLARRIIIPTQCSATDSSLAEGVFTTTTPRSAAAWRSMASTPTPWRATTLRLSAASSIFRITLPFARMIIPSTSPTAARSASSSRLSARRTSARSRRPARAFSLIGPPLGRLDERAMYVVHPNGARFHPLSGQIAVAGVATEEVGAQPEDGVVCVLEGLLQIIADFHEGQNRPERLLPHYFHFLGAVGQDCRGKEVALLAEARPAGAHLGAFGLCLFPLPLPPRELLLVDERADVDALLEPISDHDPFGQFGNTRHQRLVA